MELSRGTSGGDLDQIEDDLRRCQDEYWSALESLGIAANAPNAFDQLLRRNADHESKGEALRNQERELKKVAPKGLEPLQRRVLELETKLKKVSAADSEDADAMPGDREGLETLRTALNTRIEGLDETIMGLEKDLEGVVAKLNRALDDVTSAKQRLAGFDATANNRREELDRLRTEEQIGGRVDQARRDLIAAEDALERSELTVEETTVNDRLAASEEAVRAIVSQIRDNEEKYNRIKGRLEGSEGLHAQRAALDARVDELARARRGDLSKRTPWIVCMNSSKNAGRNSSTP